MDEVEYCIVRKNKKLAADEIRKLPRRTIPTDVSMIRIGLGPHVQTKKGGKQCGSHLLIITYPVLAQRQFYMLTRIEMLIWHVYFLLILYLLLSCLTSFHELVGNIIVLLLACTYPSGCEAWMPWRCGWKTNEEQWECCESVTHTLYIGIGMILLVRGQGQW